MSAYGRNWYQICVEMKISNQCWDMVVLFSTIMWNMFLHHACFLSVHNIGKKTVNIIKFFWEGSFTSSMGKKASIMEIIIILTSPHAWTNLIRLIALNNPNKLKISKFTTRWTLSSIFSLYRGLIIDGASEFLTKTHLLLIENYFQTKREI